MKKVHLSLLLVLVAAGCAQRREAPRRAGQQAVAAAAVEATCSGDKSCTACKNCKYCKHCSKEGGTCGVCK